MIRHLKEKRKLSNLSIGIIFLNYFILFLFFLSFILFQFQCFVFHLYKGVRAGGGIGDEIEPPDGDEYEVYRILFDITFFFFVIIILLAIVQGNIIFNNNNIFFTDVVTINSF